MRSLAGIGQGLHLPITRQVGGGPDQHTALL